MVAIGLLALAAACGGDAGGESPAPTTAGTIASTTTQGRGSTSAPTADPAIRVVLGAGRLTVGGNALVLGAPRSQVTAYLGRALGPATGERDLDCDAGPLEALTWPGVTAYVSPESGFAGWTAEDGTFRTDTGVGLGAGAADVRAAYPTVEITESSLGTELFVPDDADDDDAGLSGLLEDERVTALWSGATCVAR